MAVIVSIEFVCLYFRVNQGGGIHPGQAPTAHHVQQPAHQQTPPQPTIPQVVQPPQVGHTSSIGLDQISVKSSNAWKYLLFRFFFLIVTTCSYIINEACYVCLYVAMETPSYSCCAWENDMLLDVKL